MNGIAFLTMKKNINHYSFISIGQETDGMLGFFDGVNEQGFAAATLYFDGYANYDLPIEDKEPDCFFRFSPLYLRTLRLSR